MTLSFLTLALYFFLTRNVVNKVKITLGSSAPRHMYYHKNVDAYSGELGPLTWSFTLATKGGYTLATKGGYCSSFRFYVARNAKRSPSYLGLARVRAKNGEKPSCAIFLFPHLLEIPLVVRGKPAESLWRDRNVI